MNVPETTILRMDSVARTFTFHRPLARFHKPEAVLLSVAVNKPALKGQILSTAIII